MDKRRGKAQKDNKRDEFVENFSAFAHPIDRFALSHWYFPIFSIYILAKIVGLPIWIRTGHIWLRIEEDKFYLLFAFTLVLAVLAFNKWVIRIPHAMAAFMERDLISPKPERNIDHPYLDFLNRYQQALHSRKRFFVIAPFLLFVVGIVILMANGNSDVASDIVPFAIMNRDFFTIFYVALFYMATGLVWAYFAGVAGWIIGVTGWYLWHLPIQFGIKVQPNHPDHCGGLYFLGHFCFRMVFFFGSYSYFLSLFPKKSPTTSLKCSL